MNFFIFSQFFFIFSLPFILEKNLKIFRLIIIYERYIKCKLAHNTDKYWSSNVREIIRLINTHWIFISVPHPTPYIIFFPHQGFSGLEFRIVSLDVCFTLYIFFTLVWYEEENFFLLLFYFFVNVFVVFFFSQRDDYEKKVFRACESLHSKNTFFLTILIFIRGRTAVLLTRFDFPRTLRIYSWSLKDDDDDRSEWIFLK